MLTNAYIEAAICELMAARSERTRVTADRVVEELATLGFANIMDFMRIDVRLDLPFV
jgi:phage terminase small subunit